MLSGHICYLLILHPKSRYNYLQHKLRVEVPNAQHDKDDELKCLIIAIALRPCSVACRLQGLRQS